MKKRIVSIIVVAILLVTMLSGCGLITLNAERDGAQVVATVDVEGLQGAVTKVDLVNLFNQIGFMYIQYYGWEPSKVINEFTRQLAEREILTLNAMNVFATEYSIDASAMKSENNKYVANLLSRGTNKFDPKCQPFDLFKMMDPDEQLFVIKQTNRSLEDSFKKLVEEVEDELSANAPAEEETDKKPEEDKKEEAPLAPRAKKTLTPKTAFEKDASITVDTVKAEKTFFEKMDAKTNMTEAEKEAYSRFKKNLVKAYDADKTMSEKDAIELAWTSLLDSQKKSRLLEKYRDFANKDLAVKPEEVTARYNYNVTKDLKTVKDEASYKTAIEADKTNSLLVHNNKTGYFTVKSILLKFSETQQKALDAIKAGVLVDSDDKTAIAGYRDRLALATESDPFDVVGIGNNIGGIKVNVSNPNYDENAVCKKENCTCVACPNNPDHKKGAVCHDKNCQCEACVNSAYARYDVPYTDILNEMSTALAKAGELNLPATMTDETEKGAAQLNAKMDVFDDYIYLVNDDPGMFNSTGYVVNTDGKSSYVSEYVALCRELAKKAKADGTVGVVGGLGEISVPDPINEDAPEIKIHSAKSADGEEINYIVNDFGIHIVMVTYVAGQSDKTTAFEGTEQYRLNSDYVTKYSNVYLTDDEGKVVIDENGRKTLVKLENKTVGDIISETILNEKKAENYDKDEKAVIEKYKGKITTETKLVNKIIKDIEKELDKATGGHGHDHNH